MRIVRVLHRFFAYLIIPALGYMIGATIFIHFWDIAETDDLSGASHVITARSCVRHGPVTLRGFGYWYECQATVKNKVNGNIVTATARGFLKPELIGKDVAGTGFRRDELFAERPYAGWGMVLLLPFGLLWFYVYIGVAWPLMPERRKSRRKPVRYQRPEVPAEASREVSVFRGRLYGGWLFVGLVVGGVGAFRFTSSAFQGDAVATTATVVSCAALLATGIGVRHRWFTPAVIISPEGFAWGRTKFTWAEIEEVRLTRRNVLVVQPRMGDVVRIGRFGDVETTRIHVAMGHFCQVPYSREDAVPA